MTKPLSSWNLRRQTRFLRGRWVSTVVRGTRRPWPSAAQSMSRASYRYIVIGDSGAGKSSLLLQFTERRFQTDHDMTLGVEMGARAVTLRSGQAVKLEVWDTAGQESYLAITRSYYRGADGCLLVFDISNRASFESLPMWLSEAKQNSNNPNLVILMVGNKADLRAQRKVTPEEAAVFASANGLVYMELSATNYTEVEEAFLETAEAISKKLVTLGKPQRSAGTGAGTVRLGDGAGSGRATGPVRAGAPAQKKAVSVDCCR